MRFGLLVFALAACSSSASAKPAWPRPTPREIDGGESLAPRAAARTVAEVARAEKADDELPSEPADKPAAAAPVETPAPPPAAAPAPPTDDELMITEEIVIEIED